MKVIEAIHESPTPQFERAKGLLRELGVVIPGEEELYVIFKQSISELGPNRGYPSLIEPRTNEKMKPDSTALVVEYGGTNKHVTLFRATADNALEIVTGTDGWPIQRELPFLTKKFATAHEFYADIVNSLSPALSRIPREVTIDALSIIDSFEFDSIRTAHGIEGKPKEEMPKGFDVPGVSDTYVGKAIRELFQESGIPIPDNTPTIVMNDGVAVMLAQAHVRIAMILASGLGGGRAALHNGVLQIQNIEPGNVNGLPMSKLERTLNKISTTPGTFESETMVSGYNLERELVELVNMFRFVSPPILDVAVKRPLRTKDLSRILSLNTGDHDELRSVLIGLQSDSESMGVLNHVAYILCKRSALIAGNVFAGAVAATPGIFPDDGHPFVWPIEGPPFWKISGYHQTVKSVVEDRLNRPVDFTPASGRYGAAFGAIRMLNERHHYF